MLKVSAFGMGAGSHTPLVDCIIRDILLLPLPQVNQPLRLVGYFTYLHLVNSLLHCAPGLLVDWIQISDIRRPQIWQKSVTFLDILLSQGNVATYCGWGGNLCRLKIGPLLGFLIFVRYCSNILRVRWKSLSFENRSTSAKVIMKHEVVLFYWVTVYISVAISCHHETVLSDITSCRSADC